MRITAKESVSLFEQMKHWPRSFELESAIRADGELS